MRKKNKYSDFANSYILIEVIYFDWISCHAMEIFIYLFIFTKFALNGHFIHGNEQKVYIEKYTTIKEEMKIFKHKEPKLLKIKGQKYNLV